MHYLHVKTLVALLLFATLVSCKKDVIKPETELPRLQRPQGAAIGTPIAKTIGPEGGVIQTPDAGIVVTIPAGAVATATEFTIQPVENTLPGSKGASFRLLPEGVTFLKPVSIQFSYGALNLDATQTDLLYLTYQDSEGYFHLVKHTERNPTAKTLRVQSTHFSTWAIFAFVTVTPEKARIKRGQSVTFKLQKDPIITVNPNTGELEVAELELYEPAADVDWSKSGGGIGGTLVSTGAEAEYTAPADATGVQYLVCTVKNVETPEGRMTGEVRFIIEVIVEDDTDTPHSPADSYIALKIGTLFNDTLKHNIGGSFYNNTFMSGTFTNNGYDPKQISIMINAPVSTNSVYRYNKIDIPGAVQINLGEGFIGTYLDTYYTDCSGKVIYSGGNLTISKADPVGGFVEGTFNFTGYGGPPNYCPTPGMPGHRVPVVGSFKIYRAF